MTDSFYKSNTSAFLASYNSAASSLPVLPFLLFPLFQGLKHTLVFGKTKARKSRLWRTKAAFPGDIQ